jgi:anaerobic magnesium-protoporphyrin IX monomethyl ester cyclase
MHVVLIAPPLMDYIHGVLTPIAMDAVRACPPYGVFLLAKVLEEEGHDVSIIDLISQGSKNLDMHWPLLASCQLVGISTTSLSWPTARNCIFDIRRYRPDVPIVLGGIHATMFDKYLLTTTSANYCIRGEGENALKLLCRALESGHGFSNVPNLTIKVENGKIQRNRIAPRLKPEEIARFPVPDYSKIPVETYNGLGIESSRGCPFDCLFCSTSYRRSWRGIEPKIFVDRVEQILPYVSKTITGSLQVIDDEFSVKPDRVVEICNEFKNRKICPQLVFDSRANDLLNEDYLKALVPFALQFLVGAECGYDEGLKYVGKGTTCQKLTQAAANLKKYGLASKADFSFIIGLPWETRDDVLKTIRFATNLYATYGVRVLLQWFCQIPGSRLWEQSRQAGIVHEAQYDDYGFFRNLYLFRSGVRLTPDEIYEISDMMGAVSKLSQIHTPEKRMVEYSIPDPIISFYPKMRPDLVVGSGLASLYDIVDKS